MALVALEGLTKRFPGVIALDQLSLELEPGIIGLVGSNGAGKSPLIKTLLGLLPPTRGRALVMDRDVSREGPVVRAHIGYMPEHDCLPPDQTATDIVSHLAMISGLPRTAARGRTAEVLRHDRGEPPERLANRRVGFVAVAEQKAGGQIHRCRLLELEANGAELDPGAVDQAPRPLFVDYR